MTQATQATRKDPAPPAERPYNRSTMPGTPAHRRCMERQSFGVGVVVRPRAERELFARPAEAVADYCLQCTRYLVPEREPNRAARGDRPGNCVGYPKDPAFARCLLFLPAGQEGEEGQEGQEGQKGVAASHSTPDTRHSTRRAGGEA